MTRTTSCIRTLACMCVWAAAIAPYTAGAQTADELRGQIDNGNAQIDALNKEIAQYQIQLDHVSSKKQTLQNTITQLDLQIKQTSSKIKVTKNKIGTTQLQIQQLTHNITGKEQSIGAGQAGLAESIRRLNEVEIRPLMQSILSSGSISDSWDDAHTMATLQAAVKNNIDTLAKEKQSLADTKQETEAKKADLVRQQNQLVSQQGSLTATKQAQNDLLAQTKGLESNFQNIIAQKKAQEANLELALSDLKAKFNFVVSPSQITAVGKGVLQWPLDSIRITQYFGNTQFALAGAYNGKGHNGIDLAASIGTPVKAALTGTVIGVGNTDSVRGCYSFGKWVMIKHDNGLSTLYAHLSYVGTTEGAVVATGELIGYSGETGYATGPHLHFGVYVTSATQILKLGDATASKTPCANAVMPITPLGGYLNPMNYL